MDGHPATYHEDGTSGASNFVEAHKLPPKPLRAILELEHSDTLSADMLSGVE